MSSGSSERRNWCSGAGLFNWTARVTDLGTARCTSQVGSLHHPQLLPTQEQPSSPLPTMLAVWAALFLNLDSTAPLLPPPDAVCSASAPFPEAGLPPEAGAGRTSRSWGKPEEPGHSSSSNWMGGCNGVGARGLCANPPEATWSLQVTSWTAQLQRKTHFFSNVPLWAWWLCLETCLHGLPARCSEFTSVQPDRF